MTVAFKQQSADRLQESLALVQRLIERQRQLEDLVSRPEASEPPTDPLAPHYNLEALRLKLEQLHPADVAHILEALPLEDRLLVWDQVDGARDGAILLEVSDAVRESLIEVMEHGELVNAAEQLDADELAELAPDMPRQVVYEVMGGLDEEERAQLQSALSYDEDKVGALMDFDLVKIRADVSCEVVLRYLRRFDELPAHTDKIFVIDDLGLLRGVLSIRKLLVSDPDALVAEVMATELVSFSPDEDAADAALAFERYDLITAPVVDEAGKLIGRLTVDEMVDVIREESDSEVLNLAGLKEEEDLFAPVIDSVKNRWAWLAINLCTAFVASRVIGVFEHSISQLVALAAAGAQVHHAGGAAAGPLQRSLDQMLGFRPGDQHLRPYGEIAAVELAPADQVSHRLAGGAARPQRAETRFLFRAQFLLRISGDAGVAQFRRRLLQQHAGLQTGQGV